MSVVARMTCVSPSVDTSTCATCEGAAAEGATAAWCAAAPLAAAAALSPRRRRPGARARGRQRGRTVIVALLGSVKVLRTSTSAPRSVAATARTRSGARAPARGCGPGAAAALQRTPATWGCRCRRGVQRAACSVQRAACGVRRGRSGSGSGARVAEQRRGATRRPCRRRAPHQTTLRCAAVATGPHLRGKPAAPLISASSPRATRRPLAAPPGLRARPGACWRCRGPRGRRERAVRGPGQPGEKHESGREGCGCWGGRECGRVGVRQRGGEQAGGARSGAARCGAARRSHAGRSDA
jgi:hypothetical protein